MWTCQLRKLLMNSDLTNILIFPPFLKQKWAYRLNNIEAPFVLKANDQKEFLFYGSI